MSTKLYYNVTASIFLVIACLHLARLAYGWEAVIDDITIPLWFSWAGVILAGYLSYRGFTARSAKAPKAGKTGRKK